MTHCQSIIQLLRQRGYRITPQREMIIEAIAHSEKHMTAEQIFAEMGKRTQAANIATVYRTLEMLWEEGLACRNDLGEGVIVYAALEHGPHIHLVCRQCQRVIDANPASLAPLDELFRRQHNFEADLGHLSIFGLCRDCQQTNSQKGE
jgi:Fur family ferric uptake transcriptional regulator